jgi:hypothetical protein
VVWLCRAEVSVVRALTLSMVVAASCVGHGASVTRWVPDSAQVPVTPARAACEPLNDAVFWFGAGRDLDNPGVEAFATQHAGFAYGLCDVEQRSARWCLVVGAHRCVETLDEVQAWVQRVVGDFDRRVPVRISWQGLSGPRCRADLPTCGPEPYSAQRRWRPGDARGLIDELHDDGATCHFDGECVSESTGCVRWDRASNMSELMWSPHLEHAFCGCVEQHCRWFVPDRCL